MDEEKQCVCSDKINSLEEQMKKLTEKVSTLEINFKNVLRNEEEMKENLSRLESTVDTALKTLLPRMEQLLQLLEKATPNVTASENPCSEPAPSMEEEMNESALPTEERQPQVLAAEGLLCAAPPAYEDVVPSAPLWDELLPPTPALPTTRLPGAGRGARAQSPLELAAAKGYTSTLETLLRCGAGGERQTLDRALRAAAGPVAAHLLLDAGADPRARDACGRAALHYHAQRGLSACVSTLIDFGASVEDKDQWGRTPLHIAVEGDHEDTVKVLLAAGASLHTMNNNGQRPKDLVHSVAMRNLLRL